jgi:hypothetical protein
MPFGRDRVLTVHLVEQREEPQTIHFRAQRFVDTFFVAITMMLPR